MSPKHMTLRRFCMLAACCLFSLSACSPAGSTASKGALAPAEVDFSGLYTPASLAFTDGEGQQIPLSSFAGKPLVLLCWDETTIDPILQDVPLMREKVEAKGGAFALVTPCTNAEEQIAAQERLSALGLEQPTLFDVQAVNRTAMGMQDATVMLFFSPNGSLVHATADFTYDEMQGAIEYATNGGRQSSEDYIVHQLLNDDGLVSPTYAFSEDGDIVRSATMHSEAQSLLLFYAARKGDQALFDNVYTYTKAQSINGLSPVEQSEDAPGTDVSVADNLRILDSLLLAQDAWGSYEADIQARAQALLEQAEPNGFLPGSVSLNGGSSPEQSISLSTQDIATMKALAAYDAKWNDLAASAQALFDSGLVGDAVPFYYRAYNSQTQTYTQDDLDMADSLFALYHAACANILPSETCSRLKTWFAQQPLSARYTIEGEAVSGSSTLPPTAYAILVWTACEAGDLELARFAFAHMESGRYISSDMYNGGYFNAEDADQSTRDTLLALIAWQYAEENGLVQ